MYHFLWILYVLEAVMCLETSLTRLDLLCQAKCLETFKLETSSSNENDVSKNPFLAQSFCLKDLKCRGCSLACSSSDNSPNVCRNDCKVLQDLVAKLSCEQSCDHIASLKSDRPGQCASNISVSKCPDPCGMDSDCSKQGTKCCKTLLCGPTCQIAHLPTKNVPPIPSAPLVRQTFDKKDPYQINFDLDWSHYDIGSVKYPVIFLVQVKAGQLVLDKRGVQGVWRDLISTTKSGVIISAIDPENWYQFRLLAFSKEGYLGLGTKTTPITVQYKPINPISPRNVSEKVSRIVGKQVSVTLTWQPGPTNSLVPVSNYKISWRRFHETYEFNPIWPEYEIIIPSSETSYTIQDLLPSTVYRAQITSVVVYKGARYNSTATDHYITTSSIPNSESPNTRSFEVRNKISRSCNCGESYKQFPLAINNSTMVNGKLSMLAKLKDGIEFDNAFAPYSFRMQWYPSVCIESSSWRVDSHISEVPRSMTVDNNINHNLTDLRMQCTYKIEVELFSQLAKKNINIWDGCFCTPNCDTLMKQSQREMPNCPQNEHRIPPRPENIRISLQRPEGESSSLAQLRWDCSPSNQITAFRVTWGPRLEEPLDLPVYSQDLLPLLDSSRALSKVIRYPHQSLLLKNLDLDKIYLVKLQSMNQRLISQESVFFFKVHFERSLSFKSRLHSAMLLLTLILIFLFRQ